MSIGIGLLPPRGQAGWLTAVLLPCELPARPLRCEAMRDGGCAATYILRRGAAPTHTLGRMQKKDLGKKITLIGIRNDVGLLILPDPTLFCPTS